MIRLGRRVWLAGAFAAAFATLVIGSGLDRFSEFNPDFSRLVPGPFKAHAARQLGLAALVRDDLEAARANAELALRHEPINPRSVSLLALVRGKTGDISGADDAHRVGALLGWREVATQLYWFEENFNQRQYEAAALRLDALLRARSDVDVLQTMLTKLEATPGGRLALARRLRTTSAWANAYLRADSNSERELRARAAFLAAQDVPLASMGCDAVSPLITTLTNRGFRGDAEALAKRHCPRLVKGGSLGDPDLADFSAGNPNPFGWKRNGAGDLRVTPQADGIEIANRASVTRLVMTQPIALAPGRYVFAGRVEGLEPDALVAGLDCGAPARPGAVTGSMASGGQILVAKGCANEVLSLWMRPTNGALHVAQLSLTAN